MHFVIEIHFCVKYFKLLNSTSAGCIQFNLVLSIMFQPVFVSVSSYLPYIELSQSQCQYQA